MFFHGEAVRAAALYEYGISGSQLYQEHDDEATRKAPRGVGAAGIFAEDSIAALLRRG